MNNAYWSWILTVVGVTGFILAGRKVWWAWYINIGCQALWIAYALVTEQYGFIAAALIYTVVFSKNAWEWTRERDRKPKNEFKSSMGGSRVITFQEIVSMSEDELTELVDQFCKDGYEAAGKRDILLSSENGPDGGVILRWELENASS